MTPSPLCLPAGRQGRGRRRPEPDSGAGRDGRGDVGLIMARLILSILLTFILYYVLHFLIKGPSLRKKVDRRDGPEELVQDPYCQTYIPTSAAIKARMGGENLFFCSEECMNRYAEEKRGRASRVG